MRCPVCRADNEEKPACRRCRADLSMLWAVEEQREICLRSARIFLQRGQNKQALERIAQASGLRRGADADQLAAVAYLLDGDFAAALRHHS